MKPFADKKYRLLVGGIKYEGTTDGSGGLSEQVPADAKVGQLTLWLDEYPSGSTLEWSVDLAEGPASPASELPGALHRLRSLGYYDGELVSALTPEAAEALRWFQADYELDATGELDAAMAAKLQEIHAV